MTASLLMLLLVAPQTPRKPAIDLTAPTAFSMPVTTPSTYSDPIQLPPPSDKTTPHMNVESNVMTNYQLGLEVGDQRANIYQLGFKVDELIDKREKHDRPDIDSLLASRTLYHLTWGILSTIFLTATALFWKLRPVLWEDSIKPRMKKALN